MPLLLPLLALASGAPSVSFEDDGGVVATVGLDVSADTFKARLADPVWMTEMGGGGKTRVQVTGTEGACRTVDAVTESSVKTVRITTRQCLVDDGLDITMVSSEDFDRYAASWRITPGDQGGITATYQLDLEPSMWVPGFVMKRAMRSSLERLLTNLKAWAAAHDG
jgi:hypothetical protein